MDVRIGYMAVGTRQAAMMSQVMDAAAGHSFAEGQDGALDEVLRDAVDASALIR